MKRAFCIIFVVLLITSVSNSVSKAQPLDTIGTNHVRADGSADSPIGPMQRNGDFHSSIGNIASNPDSVLVERDKRALAEWQNSSRARQSSAELVIGINSAKQGSKVKIEDYLRENDGVFIDSVSMGNEIRAVVVDVPFSTEFSFVSAVETAGLTTFIEPNARVQADSVPNDPWWSTQWGPKKIEADYAWNTTIGSHSVLVAVVDTGVDWNHPDLAANYVPLGYDWVNNDPDPMDDYGHGTHVAGIIAAVLNNGIGIAGVAQVRIMAEKVLDETGSGTADNVARGIVDAVDKGAKIINLSLGSPFEMEIVHEAIIYANQHGVLVVAAAGNDGTRAKHYPAAYDEVVAVTATDENDKPAFFTSFGDWVTVAAPGDSIYSTMWDDSYAFLSGTSMAAPHAVGVAALIWSQFPNMTRDQVWAQLQYCADDLGKPGFDIYYGFGRVNARKAVEQAPSSHDALVLKLNTPPYLRPGTAAVINTTVLNMGTSPESNVTVQLLINGSAVGSSVIDFLMSGASTQASFSWNATSEGVYNVTSYVQPLVGETFLANNALTKNVEVRAPHIYSVPNQYNTIQKAVDAAEEGGTVFVRSGTYYENVWIQKDLSLVGENQSNTIIDGRGASDAVFVYGGKVAISELTLRNSRNSFTYSGIYAYESSEITITNVTTLNNYQGILLIGVKSAKLRDNNMTQNHYNFGVDGGSLEEFMHDIDTSNTVNGKPIYYWVNEHDRQVPSDAGYTAVINSTNITVKDLSMNEKNLDGVLFAYTNNSYIENVNATGNYRGIYLYESYNNNVLANSVKNNEFGIELYYSGDNFLEENTMTGNHYNFGVDGGSRIHFAQNIDPSNTVDAKPIYYLMNQNDKQVPTNAGYVAVVDSSNITVANSNISSNAQGVLFVNSSRCQILNVEVFNCSDAVYLWHSNNDTIGYCDISDSYDAILLYCSDGNSVLNNNVTDTWLGIDLERSNANTVSNNTVTEAVVAIESYRSYRNIIDSNTASTYSWVGIELWYSDDNTVVNNKALGEASMFGIRLVGAQSNTIKGNEAADNTFSLGYLLVLGIGISIADSSNNNTIVQNTLAENLYGIRIGDPFSPIFVDRNNNNAIYHNNFIDNSLMQAYSVNSINSWDDGYLSGGNYWSDYDTADLFSGPYQNLTGSDGIGDTPYTIDAENRDRFPYMIKVGGPHSPGDLNHDGKVDMRDMGIAARAFGSTPEHPRWNPLADITGPKYLVPDGTVDMRDIATIARNFGQKWT